MATQFPRLPADQGLPLRTDIEASQKRLKAAFGDASIEAADPCRAVPESAKDAYKGKCSSCGQDHGIPSTIESQQEAARLFDKVKADGLGGEFTYDKLRDDKGNMFGVLVCVDKDGSTVILKAFSGAFSNTGKYEVPGWSPPVLSTEKDVEDRLSREFDDAQEAVKQAKAELPGPKRDIDAINEKLKLIDAANKDAKAREADIARRTKTDEADVVKIAELNQEIERLTPKADDPALEDEAEQKRQKDLKSKQGNRTKTQERRTAWADEQTELRKEAVAARKAATELEATRAALTEEKKLKGKEDALAGANLKKAELDFKQASKNLLAHMAQKRNITNFKDETRSFESACDPPQNKEELTHNGQCGWCAAPKLLAEAKAKELTPVSMTEFWVGKTLGDKEEGAIVPSCKFCQSFIGFNLCGLQKQQQDLSGALAAK